MSEISESDIPTQGEAPVATDIPTQGEAPVTTDIPTQGEAPVATDIPTQGEAPVATDIPDATDEVKEKPCTDTDDNIEVGYLINADGLNIVTRSWKLGENTHPRYIKIRPLFVGTCFSSTARIKILLPHLIVIISYRHYGIIISVYF